MVLKNQGRKKGFGVFGKDEESIRSSLRVLKAVTPLCKFATRGLVEVNAVEVICRLIGKEYVIKAELIQRWVRLRRQIRLNKDNQADERLEGTTRKISLMLNVEDAKVNMRNVLIMRLSPMSHHVFDLLVS